MLATNKKDKFSAKKKPVQGPAFPFQFRITLHVHEIRI